MGFLYFSAPLPYHEYIKSQRWLDRAEAAKAAANRHCQRCGKEEWNQKRINDAKVWGLKLSDYDKNRETVNLEVHHLTYERLGCELPRDLKVLCTECHRIVHNRDPKTGALLETEIWQDVATGLIQAVNASSDHLAQFLRELDKIESQERDRK